MNVLIIKNIETEGPGTIEDFLREKGITYSILELYDCKAEVPDVRQYSHLVIMGGPMAVYEMEGYPFLNYEVAIIRAFMVARKPLLGICLGAQMIAHALGARVYAGRTKEIGWYTVDITDEGMKDPVFSSLSLDGSDSARVFQWHGDTFDLPREAVRLASSALYENQAFRYRDNVYALQFHIEVTPQMIREWFKDEEGFDVDEMLRQTEALYTEYHRRAFRFYEGFFS
jgi:GMP synthase-like glutamine amidotransferase